MNKLKSKEIIIIAAVSLAILSLAAIVLCIRTNACPPDTSAQELLSATDEGLLPGGTTADKNALSDSDTSSGTDVTLPDVPGAITTASAETTTTKSAKISTTTASATAASSQQGLKNAQYVINPDYKSDYYIVVFAGDSQSVAIYGKDKDGAYNVLKKCFTCSTGAKSSPTRTGQYKVWRRFRWRLLVGNVYGQYSTSISSDYLFHSVPYLKQNASSLDMAEYDKLGTPASHGCIRLCVRDSKWIYENCPNGTQVNIVNASGPEGAGYPPRSKESIYKGWDPSDPDPSNPYIKKPTTAKTTTTTTTTITTTATTSASTAASVSDASSTSSEIVSTTPATTAATTAARWVNQAEIDGIIAAAKTYAESLGMVWDSSLNTSNAYWTPDTKLATDGYQTAADCEARLKSLVAYIYNGNFGYASVNITAAKQGSGEYIFTCCFA